MAEAHQVQHGFLLWQVCTLTEEVEAWHWNGHEGDKRRREGLPEFTILSWPVGARVKVVSVSRFGDCGITTDLTAERGYDACVSPGVLLTDNETPEIAAKRAVCHNYFLEQRRADCAVIRNLVEKIL